MNDLAYSHRAVLLVGILGLASLAVGLGTSPGSSRQSPTLQATYDITIDRSGRYSVNAEFQQYSGFADSLVLSFRTQDESNASTITMITDPAGPLPFVTSSRALKRGVRDFEFSTYVVPLRGGHVVVQYKGLIGLPEGGLHNAPPSAMTYGASNSEWCVFSLSQLLLLPEGAAVRKPTIKWTLPTGWGAVDWPYDYFPTERDTKNSNLVEDLLNSARVAGLYTKHSYADANLDIVLMESRSKESATLALAIKNTYYSVQRLFDVTPRDTYRVVAVPVDSCGREGYVEPTNLCSVTPTSNGSWVSGDRTVKTMVQKVMHEVLERNPRVLDNLWFTVGIEEFVTRKLCQAEGVEVPPLSVLYAELLEDEADLTVGDQTQITNRLRLKSLCLVASLDRILRQGEVPDSIDSFLPRLQSLSADTLQRQIEQFFGISLDSFFAQYVDSNLRLPYFDTDAIEQPRVVTEEATQNIADSVGMAIVFNGGAYLETCGCKLSQAGGLARLATALKDFHKSFAGPIFSISVGNCFPTSESTLMPDSLVLAETLQYLRILKALGFDCFVLGPTELIYGYEVFESITTQADVSHITCNFQLAQATFPGAAKLERQGISLTIAGVTALPSSPPLIRTWRARNPKLRIRPVAEQAEHIFSRAEHSIKVVAGFLEATRLPMLAREVSPDVVITPCRSALVRSPDGTIGNILASGFVGRTLLIVPTAGPYGLTVATLYLDSDRNVVDFMQREVILTEQIEDDDQVSAQIEKFYNRHGLGDLKRTGIGGSATYVGAGQCASCHASQWDQWKGTAHSTAFLTLIRAHRSTAARCVPCHVTGSGWPSGYGSKPEFDNLRGVQCEVCHGAGSLHVTNPFNENSIVRTPTAQTCHVCHDAEHSDLDEQNFSDHYRKIVH